MTSSTARGLVRTWAEIDLAALRHNVRVIRDRVGPAVKVLVTVKADAYGHGYDRISRTLAEAGVDALGVANVIEGQQVRDTLNHATRHVPIFLLGANLPDEMDVVIDEEFVPMVCSLDEAVAYNDRAAARRKTLAVHVKVDTGMGRIGFWKDEAVEAVERIVRLPHLRVEGIATHFPSADDDADFSNRQIDDFLRIIHGLNAHGIHIPLRHAANSSALLNLDRSHFNLVRPGLAVYGIAPTRTARFPLDLRPVLSLKTRVVFVKDVAAGRTISYGRTFTAPGLMRIATLAIGYGDGYSRALSNRARVLIRGQFAPIVGTVTMDQTMVDVTAIPDAAVADEAVLIGRQGDREITALDLAEATGTIPYVITCSISKRVVRRYQEQKE